jgi:hypothetical protein
MLKQAHVSEICAPAATASTWGSDTGISVRAIDVGQYTKVPAPSMTFRANVASATRAPWINSNAWRFLRSPTGRFYYDVSKTDGTLAAAEAFVFGIDSIIRINDTQIEAFAEMLGWLRGIDRPGMAPLVNIGFIDDGSAESGEFMNLLVRRNLLFRVVRQPDPKLNLTVALGTPDYPRSEAATPSLLAEKVRAHLTDHARLLRIYGSEVVIGRLMHDEKETRAYLLNYGKTPVEGIRVRVLGAYSAAQTAQGAAKPEEIRIERDAIEFTLPELKTLTIVDLSPAR